MATEFDDTEELHYIGLYNGVVVDNLDPKGLGRVRLRVQGLVEPSSAWALPFGGIGGGTKARGIYDTPNKGADVGVMFLQGDVDHPIFFSGHWGITDAGRETPLDIPGLSPLERTQVKGWETNRYQLIFDERPGKERFVVLDKETGDTIDMSPGKTVLKHSKLVVVDAPKVFLGGDDLDENPISGEGVALASGVDTFSGQTHGQLGGASTKVFAKK